MIKKKKCRKNTESAHNEVIFTAKLENAKAIFFTRSYIEKEPASHPHARILLAIYLKTQLEKEYKISLPIVEHSNSPSFLRETNFTEEQIVELWKELCRHYLSTLNKDKNEKEHIASMSPEKLETLCIYCGEPQIGFESPDKYYDEGLKSKVRKSLEELQKQSPIKSSFSNEKKSEITDSSNVQPAVDPLLKDQLLSYLSLSRKVAQRFKMRAGFFTSGMNKKAERINQAIDAVEKLSSQEFKSVEDWVKYKSPGQAFSLFEALHSPRMTGRSSNIPELKHFHKNFHENH